MVKRLVVTRPQYDLATHYLHDFSKEIITTIRSAKDIHATNLEGSKAVRKNLENTLIKEKPGLVFLNGHGDKKEVKGHKGEVILDKFNIELTKGKIVYALSCDSLEELGKLAIKKGTKSYIGYRARFMIVRDPSREGAPSKDKNALPFKRACAMMINALVFGNTVSRSIDLTKKEYLHSIRSYGTSEDDPFGDTPLIRLALAWDLEFLDMEGDPNASF